MDLDFTDKSLQNESTRLALFLGVVISACSVYDPDIIVNIGQDANTVDGSESGLQSDGSAETDSRSVSDSGSSVESGVDGDAAQSIDDGGDAQLVECRPNSDPSCPLICPEVCDDLDNDCNNKIDDGDLWLQKGESCSVGIGECMAEGVYICDETDPEGQLVCSVTPSDPSDEVCDGRDNDCDGEIDESFPDTNGDGVADCTSDDDDDDGIDNMSDNCPLVSNPDQEDFDEDDKGDACDTDDDNDSDPDESDCAPLDPAIYNGAAEICDDLDNDCNDEIDDGIYCGVTFSYDPSNFQPDDLHPASAPETVSLECDAVFDSSGDTPTFEEWCGQPTPVVTVDSSGATEVAILTLRDFTLIDSGSLTLIGDRPVILVIFGDANIDGDLDASARGATPGPGGNLWCSSGNGGNGSPSNSDNDGAGGGGGGAFGDNGGNGAAGQYVFGGVNGVAEGNPELVPLRGGCPGGWGGRGSGSTSGRFGGGGGGAVQISAAGTLSITGVVSAAGGGGQAGNGMCDGGGGGGSGGAVLLEANTVQIDSGAWVTANGGGGGGGTSDRSSTSGTNGQDGLTASRDNAVGGSGGGDGGYGGDGGSADDLTGDNGSQGGGGGDRGGGGGGGGGVGRVRVNAFDSCTIDGTVSASTSLNGC